MRNQSFDPAVLGDNEATLSFVRNLLESSTEYSTIGKDLEGNRRLWNEDSQRIYGYAASEAVGKANCSILHPPEATPGKDASGRMIGALLISKDISAEIQLKSELRKLEENPREVLETAPATMVIVTAEGKDSNSADGCLPKAVKAL